MENSEQDSSEGSDEEFLAQCRELTIMHEFVKSAAPPISYQLSMSDSDEPEYKIINGVRCKFYHLIHPDLLDPDLVLSSDSETSLSEDKKKEIKDEQKSPDRSKEPSTKHRSKSPQERAESISSRISSRKKHGSRRRRRRRSRESYSPERRRRRSNSYSPERKRRSNSYSPERRRSPPKSSNETKSETRSYTPVRKQESISSQERSKQISRSNSLSPKRSHSRSKSLSSGERQSPINYSPHRSHYKSHHSDVSEDDEYSQSLKEYSMARKLIAKHASEKDSSDETKYDDSQTSFDATNEYNESFDDTFFCKYCHKTMNSEQMWESHISGKKHFKAVKLANPEIVAKESVKAIQADINIIRQAPPGFERIRTTEVSRIQKFIDELPTNVVCTGLNHVLEIVSSSGTLTYYCELCSAPCVPQTIMPHLTGFKHQLNCVKVHDPELYEKYAYDKKQKVAPKVEYFLKKVEQNQGRGTIQVVRDRPLRPFCLDLPGPSHVKLPAEIDDIKKAQEASNVPDSSKGDLYCNLCDSHMNSYNMWTAHINGKRHLKNLKKAPGELPSKVKHLKVNMPARLMERLPEGEVIVGLDYIQEKHNELGGETYTCHLCSGCCTSSDILEHICSLKHRRKYLERENKKRATMIGGMAPSLRNIGTDPLILDACRELMLSKGCGQVEVCVPKR